MYYYILVTTCVAVRMSITKIEATYNLAAY